MHSLISLVALLGLVTSSAAFNGRFINLDGDDGSSDADIILIDSNTNIQWRADDFPGFDTCIDRCLMTWFELTPNGDGPHDTFQGFLSKDLRGCVNIDLRGNLGGAGQFQCCDDPGAVTLPGGSTGSTDCNLNS